MRTQNVQRTSQIRAIVITWGVNLTNEVRDIPNKVFALKQGVAKQAKLDWPKGFN